MPAGYGHIRYLAQYICEVWNMRKVALKIVVGVAIALVLAVATIAGIRLFSDGPIEMVPGGPMSGTRSLEDFPGFGDETSDFIELQVNGWIPSSRTVIGFLFDKSLYIPSVRAESKWWPSEVLNNPKVIVRLRGVLYPRTAIRVTDPARILQLQATVVEAETLVSAPEMFKEETTWFFRLEPINN
jgi:hypothetical protein